MVLSNKAQDYIMNKAFSPFFDFLIFLLMLTPTTNVLAQESSESAYNQENKSRSTEKLQLYLLIGQSNMSGRGSLKGVSPTEDSRILMLDSLDQWVPAKDPLHFDRSYAGVGPGLSFAQHMLDQNPDDKIGLIPCAWGGSSIDVW